MINKNDFVYLDNEGRPYRVQKSEAGHAVFILKNKEWVAYGSVGSDDVMAAMLARAIGSELSSLYEYGVPFLPMPQMDMFNAGGPYRGKDFITPKAGKLNIHVMEVFSEPYGSDVRKLLVRFGPNDRSGDYSEFVFN